MGTLCKNCPFKNAKKEGGCCTTLFAKKYHNSCVTYDIAEDMFFKDLEEFCKEKEKQNAPIFEEIVKTTNTIVKDENREKTVEEKVNAPKKTTKRVSTKKATTPRKSTAKKITKKTKTEENE